MMGMGDTKGTTQQVFQDHDSYLDVAADPACASNSTARTFIVVVVLATIAVKQRLLLLLMMMVLVLVVVVARHHQQHVEVPQPTSLSKHRSCAC